jgi:Ca-activated chloride channel family protein
MRRPLRSLRALLALSIAALLAACPKSESIRAEAPLGNVATLDVVAADESTAQNAPDAPKNEKLVEAPPPVTPTTSPAPAEEKPADTESPAHDPNAAAPLRAAKPMPTMDLRGDSGGVLGGARGAGIGTGSAGMSGMNMAHAKQLAMESAKESARESTKSERKTSYAMPPPPPPKDSKDDDARSSFEDGGEFVSAGTNPLVDPNVDALSTFAIDVDTGSYTLARRYLENGQMPPVAGVRVEEWVNAFHYAYADDAGEHPFSIHMEGAPLAKRSYMMRIGIQGKRIEKAERAPVHLTFLVDVSGSMSNADRLPLAKKALALLVDELGPKDSVGLVTYAGDTRVVLPATAVTNGNRAKIKGALEDLRNGGGTAMGSGMELAYREAGKALGDKGVSRVIVLSDGDANIGRTSHQEMLKSIKGYVSEGVTMSTVGFGTGNLRDHLMEQLANAGNGNYSYVGSIKDAKRIFVDDLTGTLQVIAKDTKIQVEMNKDVVESYRLVGYENRDIADKDFRNDKVDAGEIGAGHTVTAIYEVTLKDEDTTSDIATVRVRYKQPRGDKATEVSAKFAASSMKHDVNGLNADGKFALGVALTAEVFRHSQHMDRLGIGLADAHALLVQGAKGPHAEERMELVRLIAPLAAGANVARAR